MKIKIGSMFIFPNKKKAECEPGVVNTRGITTTGHYGLSTAKKKSVAAAHKHKGFRRRVNLIINGRQHDDECELRKRNA